MKNLILVTPEVIPLITKKQLNLFKINNLKVEQCNDIFAFLLNNSSKVAYIIDSPACLKSIKLDK